MPSISPDEIEKILEKTFKDGYIFAKQLVSFLYGILTHYIENNSPDIKTVEKTLLDILDGIFSPRQLVKQVAIISALQVLVIACQVGTQVCTNVLNMLTKKGRREKKLLEDINNATSYEEWQVFASALDAERGFELWRKKDHCSLYDDTILRKRIQDMNEMMDGLNFFYLIFRLRGGLARDQYGMQHEGLFSKAMAGTKYLVEEYHETVARALNLICDSRIIEEENEVPLDAKLAFFNEVRHSYGRTALLLSGGAYLGYYHVGVIKALWSQNLMPRVISGASAGSIITALIGTRTDEEVREQILGVGNSLPASIRLDFFRFSTELKSEFARKIQYFIPYGLRWLTSPIFSMLFDKKLLNLDTEHFLDVMKFNVGEQTFQEAFDRTGRIINITVAPLNNYDPPRLLNYLTAPHVCIWSAAAASCALPGMFDSVNLIVKEPTGAFRRENEWTVRALKDDSHPVNQMDKVVAYSDGSLENDLPMQQLSELFNVNHFIVSQVNPHSAILSSMALKASVWSNPVYGALVGYVRFLKAQCKDWLKNVVNLLIFRLNAPVWSARRGVTQMLTQEYEGRGVDVTIMPWVGHTSALSALMSAIKNPTPEEYFDVVAAGEKNTWPSIPRIRAHCLVEITLDKCVQRLRKRVSEEVAAQESKAAATTSRGFMTLSPAGSKKMDRTPSFYTSRSIVNLSGLSVADPQPAALHRLPQDRLLTKIVSSPKGRAVRALSRDDDRGSVPVSISDEAERDPRDDLLTLNVHMGEVPMGERIDSYLQGFNGSGGGSGKGSSNSLVRQSRSNSIASNHSNGRSSDSLKDYDGQIHKTTNMANFYYKHSPSTADFSSLLSSAADSSGEPSTRT